ncbi:glycosyltransferase family 2 protein [Paenibacillus sp. F411]|uniref:glycosyltransferase family 2 protein n=1 Tax=Paenibacillus sp. F411 TaxID=2820239 RepID=UPI001AAFC2EA|nr:glycosyltransferase family 2 protein [Paenibacillus sp. F411]MBO2945354.1 glycosyltransferase family 2 protein [Paenibacillus sp. F411]
MIDVGVVMPLYKQEPEFLRAAIDSLRSQRYEHFIVIVVIDGAPEMEPLVREYIGEDDRFVLLPQPENRGVAAALNKGFEELFTFPDIRYVTWVSSDNIYYPDFLQRLRQRLSEGPEELGLVYSSFQSISNEGTPLHSEYQLAAQRKYQSSAKDKLLDACIIGVSFMYKAQYAKLIDGYHMVPVEDYEYWLRLTEHCDIRYLPVELMDYRVDSTFSVSASLKDEARHRQWRYTYHLARHQARVRQGIPHALTVIYPLSTVSPVDVARIENLYDQSFSNYVTAILDLSPDESVSAALSNIPHPLTKFMWLPGEREDQAVYYAAQMIETPFAMMIGTEPFAAVTDLEVLTKQLLKAPAEVESNYYNSTHSDVDYRYPGVPFQFRAIQHELFRTDSLRARLKTYMMSQRQEGLL